MAKNHVSASIKVEIFILQSQGEPLHSVQPEITNSSKKTSQKIKSIGHKIILTTSELSQFTIVAFIGWLDPVSGTCIGVFFLLLNIVKIWKEDNK